MEKAFTMRIMLIAILYMVIFQFQSSNLVIQASIIFGIIISYNFVHTKSRSNKVLALSALLFSPILSLLIIALINSVHVTILPLIVWPCITLVSALVGFLSAKLPIDKILKKVFFAGLLVLFLAIDSRKLGEGWFASITILCFVSGAIYVAAQQPKKGILTLVIYFTPAFLSNIAFFDLMGLKLVLPVYLIASTLSVVIFYILLNDGSHRKLYGVGCITLICALSAWPLQENYAMICYCSTYKVIGHNANFDFIDCRGDTIPSTNTRVNVYLFWSASCGQCQKEYPYFSNLAKEYHEQNDVSINAVFLSFRKSDTSYFKTQIQENYSFNWGFAVNSEKVYNDFEMTGVPYLLIVSNKGKVLYNGYPNIRPWLFVNRPQRIIANALIE